MSKMCTGCFIVLSVIILMTQRFVHGLTSGNTPSQLTCRHEFIAALGRHCNPRKRSTAPAPMPGDLAEEELDYSDIIGQALRHADAKARMPELDAQLYSDFKSLLGPSGQGPNPNEEHPMFYKESYPTFQQPRINPLSAYFNSFRGQQRQQQPQMPPAYAVPLSVPINPRIRRMYDLGHQLVTKCCGEPVHCYGQELAILSPGHSNTLCGK